MLTRKTWCCCTAFHIGGARYLFLNDSMPASGRQGYAVVRVLDDGEIVELGSFLFGECFDRKRAGNLIRRVIAGGFDDSWCATTVDIYLETPQEHGRCHFCQ